MAGIGHKQPFTPVWGKVRLRIEKRPFAQLGDGGEI